MSSAWIVESVDVSANSFFGSVSCLENRGPDEFCLDGLEDRFDHCVIVAISLAAHRSDEAVFLSSRR